MIYELAKTEDLQTIYDVVQHTIRTIYPLYYPVEVVDFYEVMEKELHQVSSTINYDGRKFVPKMNSENGEVRFCVSSYESGYEDKDW